MLLIADMVLIVYNISQNYKTLFNINNKTLYLHYQNCNNIITKETLLKDNYDK